MNLVKRKFRFTTVIPLQLAPSLMSYQTVQRIFITWLIYTHVFIHPPTHSHCYVALSSLTTFRISLCTIDSNKMAASSEGFATSPNTYLQGNQKRQHTQSTCEWDHHMFRLDRLWAGIIESSTLDPPHLHCSFLSVRKCWKCLAVERV